MDEFATLIGSLIVSPSLPLNANCTTERVVSGFSSGIGSPPWLNVLDVFTSGLAGSLSGVSGLMTITSAFGFAGSLFSFLAVVASAAPASFDSLAGAPASG